MSATTPSRVRKAITAHGLSRSDRAFVQERLARFGLWIFWPAFAFLSFSYVPAYLAGQPAEAVFGPPFFAHLAGTGALLGIWFYCRSERVRPTPVLRALDGFGVTATALMWIALGFTSIDLITRMPQPRVSAVGNTFTILMAVTYTVLARAILVPSGFARTLIIGALSTAGVIPLVAVSMAAVDFETGAVLQGTIATAIWVSAAVITSAATSRVIFGLRREVQQSKRLGQYTIEHKIGAGGMGEVYRANHAMLRRPTAIKLLSPELSDGDAMRRFEREVQLTALLSHPNTISVYDYGRTPDGLFYYAMEYLEGINLDHLVRDHGPIGAGRAITILEQICGSLTEAHGIGLIHRDIKPANVILCPRGGEYDIAKVVDFGLVKEIAGDVESSLSGANILMGTPAYLAPEAIHGDDLDGRADLYAVGAVAYWLVTGAMVFEGNNLVEVCGHHLHTAPTPPAERAPDLEIPADLAAVILRCLAKDPADRYRDAASLREALGACDAAGTWSREDAAAWWQTHAPTPHAADRESHMPTMAVDLADRLGE